MDDEKECCICLQKLKNNISKLDCFHLFHDKCINEWRKKNNICPICRKNIINISHIYYISNVFIALSLIILFLSLIIIIIFKSYIGKIFNFNNNKKIFHNIFIKIKIILEYAYIRIIRNINENEIQKIKNVFSFIYNPKKYIINYLKDILNFSFPEKIKKEKNENNQIKFLYLILFKSIEKFKQLSNIIFLFFSWIF